MGSNLRISCTAALAIGALIVWLALRGAEEAREPAALEAGSSKEAARAEALDANGRVLRREEAPASPAVAPESAAASPGLRDLVVRVLDASGEPVDDVDVQLRTAARQPSGRGDAYPFYTNLSRDDELPRHGMRVPSAALAEAFAKAREAREVGRESGVYLVAPSCMVTCTVLELDEEDLPQEEIELRLEPSGFLRLEALRPDGIAHEGLLLVRLTTTASKSAAAKKQRWQAPWESHRELRVPGDRVRVPLSGRLRASFGIDMRSGLCADTQSLPGPRFDGEEILMQVQLRDARSLSGRLLDTTGEPLVAQAFLVESESSYHLSSLDRGTTDAEGRFRIVLPWDPEMRRLERLRLFPIDSRDGDPMPRKLEDHPHAVFEALELPEGAVADLGDVVLQPSGRHFLASGVVVDPMGSPIEGASVCASIGDPPRKISDADLFSDRDGAFEIFCDERVARAGFAAEKQGYFFERRVDAAAGEKGLRLVLKRGAVIEGRVLVPQGFPTTSLEVHRLFAGQARTTVAPNLDGSFRFDGCEPGTHALAFQLGPWKPVQVLGDLAIHGEEACSDPRLLEIDLRERVATLRIRAFEPLGEPMAHQAFLLSADQTQDVSRLLLTDGAGRASLGLPIEVQTVAISLRAGAPAVIPCGPGEHEVRLAEPLVLELVLEPAPELPDGVWLAACVELSGSPAGAHLRPRFRSPETPFRDGVAKLRVPLVGSYELRWIACTEEVQARREALEDGEPRVLDVDTATQRLTLSPPLDALRAALAKLGR